MLDPVPLHRSGTGGDAPPGDDPHRCQVALLPEVGAQNPHVEIPRLHPPEPALQHVDGRIDGEDLVVVDRGAGADGAGVDPIGPEQRPDADPVAGGQPLGVAIEDLVNGVFVPPASGRGAILDPASRTCQETETEDRKTQAVQADRCVSSTWASSSWFSRRVLGVSSE